MTILNIVDNITQVNFGIWNAAIAPSSSLKGNHQIKTLLWFPAVDEPPILPSDVNPRSFISLSASELRKAIKEEELMPSNTIVVTHGCWQFPSIWGATMKKMGFRWIYVPHGMLEPWSMNQKKWKKAIYLKLREYPLTKKADWVKAVGKPELENLRSRYQNVWLNPNGIALPNLSNCKWESPEKLNYLFMARLHHKKGILPLIEAWLQSPQLNNNNCHLYIAGPDDGELDKIKEILRRYPEMNVTYLGGIYGKEKEALLNQCHVYLLPSYSEGFPTSVLEAMSYQMVTVITDGCNFPEAILAQKVYRTTTAQQEIVNTLKKIHRQSTSALEQFAKESAEWVIDNYSMEKIASDQAEMYQKLLSI